MVKDNREEAVRSSGHTSCWGHQEQDREAGCGREELAPGSSDALEQNQYWLRWDSDMSHAHLKQDQKFTNPPLSCSLFWITDLTLHVIHIRNAALSKRVQGLTWAPERRNPGDRLQLRTGGYVLESDGNQALDRHMEAIIDGLSEESWLLETPLPSHASTWIYQVQVFTCNRRHMDPLLLPHIYHCMSRRCMAPYNTMGVCCVNCCYSVLFRE